MTYYDRLNYFFKFIRHNHVKPSSQLVYLHLLQIQNELRGSLAFYVSDRALSDSTGLSQKAIFESRNALKNLKLINFKVVNHRVKYLFPEAGIDSVVAEKSESRPEVAAAEFITVPQNKYPEIEKKNAGARGGLVRMDLKKPADKQKAFRDRYKPVVRFELPVERFELDEHEKQEKRERMIKLGNDFLAAFRAKVENKDNLPEDLPEDKVQEKQEELSTPIQETRNELSQEEKRKEAAKILGIEIES